MKSEIDIRYMSTDTAAIDLYKWEFRAYQRDKLVWKFSGYGKGNDNKAVKLYVDDYWDFRPKHLKKVIKKVSKQEPFYILTKEDGLFFIESQQKVKQRAEIKKVA